MKSKTLTLFILLFSVQLFAQDKSETIPHDIKYGGFQFKALPDGGFIFARNVDGKNYEMKHFDKDYNLISTNSIKSSVETTSEFISSPSGEFLYLLQSQSAFTGNDKKYIYSINGAPVKIENESLHKLSYLTIAFAGNKYLYFITPDENGVKLYTIDHSTKKGKTIVPKVSKQEASRYCTGWRYAGHDSKNIYLSSKTVDFTSNVYLYKVAILDAEGVVQKEFELKGKPKDCIYPSRVFNTYLNSDNAEIDDVYEEGVHYFTIHTYSGLTIDTINKAAYVTGAQGQCNGYYVDKQGGITLRFGFPHWVIPKPGTRVTGMFVHKFDFDVKQLWEYNSDEYSADFATKMTGSLAVSRVMATRMSADSKTIEIAHASSETNYGNIRQVMRINITTEGALQKKELMHYTGIYPMGQTDINALFDCDDEIVKANGMAGLKALDGFEAYNTGVGKVSVYFHKKDKAIKLKYFKN